MDTKRIEKYRQIKDKETIFFWVIYSLVFLGIVSFFVLVLINNPELNLGNITIIVISITLFLALIIVFYYVYGAIKFQKITINIDMYIKDKKYDEGIKYLLSLKDFNYFFISFDKIYYYLSILYLYVNNIDVATEQFVYICKYKKTDTVVLFNTLKYLFLLFITSSDERIEILKNIYNKEKLAITNRHSINKYINSEINLQIKIIDDLISDDKKRIKNSLLQFKKFDFVSNYISKMEE